MISFEEALALVLQHPMDWGEETVSLNDGFLRILAEDILADRDFPPFDRVTKDGIAINFEAYRSGVRNFKIQEVAPAGQPQKVLTNNHCCLEVMTGAMMPKGTDTVVMYEHLELKNGHAHIQKEVTQGQGIHLKGSDELKGSLLLPKGTRIETAETGVLATVGKSGVRVKKLPRVAIISTGDELVDVSHTPEPYQIRTSNAHTLLTALKAEGVAASLFHFQDDRNEVTSGMAQLLQDFDVLLLSGGVSKGKFDYLPSVFEELGVQKLFHRVLQRPGKPFWFGRHQQTLTTIFAFPGNPGSTFANYHVYFLPWLYGSLQYTYEQPMAILADKSTNPTDLTLFQRGWVGLHKGRLRLTLVKDNGSGDLTSLSKSNALFRLEPHKTYTKGDLVSVYPTKRIGR